MYINYITLHYITLYHIILYWILWGSINGDIPKWMVYNGKSIYKWMIQWYRATLHFRKPPYTSIYTYIPKRKRIIHTNGKKRNDAISPRNLDSNSFQAPETHWPSRHDTPPRSAGIPAFVWSPACAVKKMRAMPDRLRDLVETF